ncbi:hypothetical protein PE066_13185 [Ramlibacter tataouinensis]|uniref:hypothetical protein n=1 Tax=Ramlibacter tataouinensis TaxID=94132 RepID=UPI0022F3CF01|nr:hypothetical protein [Ramlibacter tataouinensis]WBY00421.1 hypothetical protein PE066_13185 [Ramlibacter tataouinensis]
MRRRSWLKLGIGAAAVLAIGGGAVALLGPGWQRGRLAPAGRTVFTHVGRALLEGSLPANPAEQAAALDGLLDRVDALVAALPPHAQQELSQLLSLLATSAGRRALAGLAQDWPVAPLAGIQQGLQSMRISSLSLRRQAYQALHDITGAAYFSDRGTWPQLGYPGPMDI